MIDPETGLGFPAPHPGRILKDDVLPDTGLTIEQFAERLGVKRAGVSELLNQRKPVSLDMAIRLGKALGTGTRFWLALQMQYDLATEVPKKEKDIRVARVALNGGNAA
jgi:addiction module HigA family antidote